MSLRMQAGDFFHAYQILSENNKALMTEPAPGMRYASGVDIVCLAFSVELYTKDVYSALNIKPPRSHNILKLYEGLPEQTRQEIFVHEAISQNPFATRGDIFSPKRFTSAYSAYDGFIDEIKAISDGFEKWRYSYEWAVLQYNTYFALAFIEAIKSVADAMRGHRAPLKQAEG